MDFSRYNKALMGCGDGRTIFRSLEPLEAAVSDFHEKHDGHLGNPQQPRIHDPQLRYDLLKEEVEEFKAACEAGDLVKAIDGLADIVYVAIGGFVAFGVEAGPVLEEVHRSNMTKTPGGKRGDGKILKGPDYEPPDIAGVLDAQRDYYSLPDELKPSNGDLTLDDFWY